jgi:hypothetical protein
VSEGATFSTPSGIDINLRLNLAPDELDASDLAAQMEDAARAEVEGIDDISASTVQLRGGRVAHERRFACTRAGVASVGRILCVVEGGLALTASASWPADGQVADAEMDEAVASVRLLARPLATVRTGAESEATRAPAKRPSIDPSAWAELRTAWSRSQPVGADVLGTTRWSPAELAVCATILGASSFPTVGAELLASLPEVALNATLDVVTRSFVARGLVRAGDDGFAALSEPLQQVMEVAALPDLTILVERLAAAGNGRWWFGLRTDRAVQVTVLRDGSRDCGAIEPEAVIGQIMAITGTPSATNRSSPGPERVTSAEIIDGSTPVAALVRVNTAWRDGDLVRGGVLTWAVGADGACWLAEPAAAEASPTWNLRSTDLDALRAEILEHLPGA